MSRSDRPLRLAARFRGRVLREVPVFGLRAPATVRADGSEADVELGDAADAQIVHGFATAVVDMMAMDLSRRLWSGRLAELLGERSLESGLTVVDLDVFVRVLGLRYDAEAEFRGCDRGRRDELSEFAAGVNAWIDSGAWTGDERWAGLRSRPRLWGAADSLLSVGAAAAIDGSGRALDDAAAREAGWTDGWAEILGHLWAALHHPSLRAPGAAGGWGAAAAPALGAPRVVPVEVLDGGDNHRYLRQDGSSGRLRARRVDVAVRGAPPHRAWVRRSDRGGLISDALRGAGATAPSGRAFAWSWGESKAGTLPAPALPELPSEDRWRLVEQRRRVADTFRLVPLDGGA